MFKSFAVCSTTVLGLILSAPIHADEESDSWETSARRPTTADVKNIFRTRCLECHGDTRREADIHILKPETFVGDGLAVVPGDVDESFLYDVIAAEDEDYRMPEAPRPPLTQGEIEKVRRWIAEGAPGFPKDVAVSTGDSEQAKPRYGNNYVLDQIQSYILKLPRDKRAYVRFFSSNHLLVAGVTPEELELNRQALSKAINHLSWQPDIVKPVSVDEGVNSVFAVDIRDLGWHERIFEAASGESEIAESTDLYDLVLLEYPYGFVQEDNEDFAELFERYMEPAKLVRPIPYVRIDWFISVDWFINADWFISVNWFINVDLFINVDWFINIDWFIRSVFISWKTTSMFSFLCACCQFLWVFFLQFNVLKKIFSQNYC